MIANWVKAVAAALLLDVLIAAMLQDNQMVFEMLESQINNAMMASYFSLAIGFVFTGYGLYLNWKQSKVKDQMAEVIELLKQIRNK